MAGLLAIKKKECPFCKEEHFVTYQGSLAFQSADGSRLNVYKCPVHNKEFRVKEYAE